MFVMVKNNICVQCTEQQNCSGNCSALEALISVCKEEDQQEKGKLIKSYAKDLNIQDCEVAEDIRVLSEKIITAMPELDIIRDWNVKIGYVRSQEAKTDKGRAVNADCRKVTSPYDAYLPFDFIITVYEPNVYYLSENQRKILLLHELKHIGMGEKGLRIEPHDIEDFESILLRYGMKWNGFNQECPDILGGGDNGKEVGRKQQKMETKREASGNGGASHQPRGPKNEG